MFGQPPASNNHSIAVESYWRLSQLALALALTLHVVFAAFFFVLRVDQLVWIECVDASVYAGCIVLAKRRMRNLVTVITWLELIAHALVASRLLGWASGFQYYMWILIPLIFFNTESRLRTKLLLASLVVVFNVGAAIWLQPLAPAVELSTTIVDAFNKFNIASYLGASGLLALIYARAVGDAERQLHLLATTDALTGLANRRRLLEIATHEIARVRRAFRPMCVIALDIDNFKSINDRFGHAVGDSVLLEVTRALRRTLRVQDHVARWGGEEFLILMPGVALDVARTAAERIRLTLASTAVAVHGIDMDSLRITVTLGVSEWRSTEDIEQCIARADAAMYRGKGNGRDRVEVHDLSPQDESPLQAIAV